MIFDLRTEMMQIDYDFVDALVAQQQQGKFDHRPACYLNQRFGHAIGDRPQACALSGGQHHRFHSIASKCSFKSGKISRVCATCDKLRWSRRTVGGINFLYPGLPLTKSRK